MKSSIFAREKRLTVARRDSDDISENKNGGSGERPAVKQRLRLPFDGRRDDPGAWAYDHRAGLAVTLIVYLLVGISFVAGKIVVGRKPSQTTMLVDLQSLERLEQERERLEREVRERQLERNTDWRSIRNAVSNENALNEKLVDDRGTNTAQLNESADDVERRMRANRSAYEKGLAEARAAGERTDKDKDKGERAESARLKGRVTVSYSLNNPLRHHRHLDKPAYKCEGGGEVVVNIVVNRLGEVVGASVASGGDACMRETALRSARASVFNADDSAPARQSGTITYVFIPQ